MNPADLQFPIVLTSPDGRCFRRIQRDGYIEAKQLGLPWEPSMNIEDRPYIRPLRKGGDIAEAIADYVATLTGKLRWKLSRDTAPESHRCPGCGCRFTWGKENFQYENPFCHDCQNEPTPEPQCDSIKYAENPPL